MAKSRNLPNGQNRGRLPVLNPRIASAVVAALSLGNFQNTVCQYVGISTSSYNVWRQRGEIESAKVADAGYDPESLIVQASINEEGDPLGIEDMFGHPAPHFEPSEWMFVVFKFLTDRAKAAAEIKALTTIQQAMPDNWQAAGWYLERTYPDRYGRRERVNLSGANDGDPVKLEHTVSADSLEAKLLELRQTLTKNEE